MVCAACGNEGQVEVQSVEELVTLNSVMSIGDPANLEDAIAVGSVNQFKPHLYGISYFSSRGPTADGARSPTSSHRESRCSRATPRAGTWQ